MAPWIEKLIEEGKEILNSLRARIVKLLDAAVDEVEAAAEENKDKIEGDISQFFRETADDAVAVVSSTPGDWNTKLVAALGIIAADFATKGLVVGKTVIITLIMGAYSRHKANNGV